MTARDERVIALEVTSFGGDDWQRTDARIKAAASKGTADLPLNTVWSVVVHSGAGIRDLQPRLTEVLNRLEEEGKLNAGAGYDGEDRLLRDASSLLADLGVSSAAVLNRAPNANEPKIVFSQVKRWVGTAETLPLALEAVFEKRDNQAKLAAAVADERHLFVWMEDEAAAARFQTAAPLRQCPRDPVGVVDVLWVSSLFMPGYVCRVTPGMADWNRFLAATGEQAPPPP